MIAVIDYEVGNLFSLKASLEKIGANSVLTRDPVVIHAADAIILPGVGAFGQAADKLRALGLDQVILREAYDGKPILGICLGMQLLFEKSYEYGEHQGLGLLPGYIGSLREDLPNPDSIVPHMGWNELNFRREEDREKWLPQGKTSIYTYFVHSFYAKECDDVLVADAEYEGIRVPGIVGKDKIWGMQFHPEKSGTDGLSLLRRFIEMTEKPEVV